MVPPAGTGASSIDATGTADAASSTWHGVRSTRVVERRRPRPPPDGVDEALDQAPVQAAHEVGVGLGQLAERAVGEGDGGARRRRRPTAGSKPSAASSARRAPSSAGASPARPGRRRRPRPCSRPASTASSAPAPAPAASAQQHAGQQRERRRLEPERRGVGGERVAVLGPADARPGRRSSTSSSPTSRMRSRWGRTVLACRSSVSAISAVASGTRRAGQLEVDGVAGVVAERLEQRRAGARPAVAGSVGHRHRGVYTGCAGRIRACRRPPLPTPDDVMARAARASSTPSWAATSSSSGMVRGRRRRRRRRRRRHHRPHHRRLPAAGPDPARHPRPGSARCPASPTVEARVDRDDPGARRPRPWRKARWNVAQRAEDTVGRPPTTRVDRSSPRARAASASRRSPSTWPPPSPPRGLTVGVLDADIWGFSVPRMLGVDGPARRRGRDGDRKLMVPHERTVGDGRRCGSCRWASSSRTRRPRSCGAGLMLNRGVQHFLQDVALGRRPRLPAHRHAAGHRRRADGRGQAAAPRRGASWSPRPAVAAQKVAIRAVSHGPQELPAGGRRHREHERLHLRPRRDATRCSARAAAQALAADAGVPLLGQVPLEPAVSAGGDAGEPVVLGAGPAAEAFRAIADRIVDEASRRWRWPAAAPGCSTPPSPPSTRSSGPSTRYAAAVQRPSTPAASSSGSAPLTAPSSPACRRWAHTVPAATGPAPRRGRGRAARRSRRPWSGPCAARRRGPGPRAWRRWARYSSILASGCSMRWPWPGAIARSAAAGP